MPTLCNVGMPTRKPTRHLSSQHELMTLSMSVILGQKNPQHNANITNLEEKVMARQEVKAPGTRHHAWQKVILQTAQVDERHLHQWWRGAQWESYKRCWCDEKLRWLWRTRGNTTTSSGRHEEWERRELLARVGDSNKECKLFFIFLYIILGK